MEEHWGEGEKPGAGAEDPSSSTGSPTREKHAPAPQDLAAPPDTAAAPVARMQTRMTDFLSSTPQTKPAREPAKTAKEAGAMTSTDGLSIPTENEDVNQFENDGGGVMVTMVDGTRDRVTKDENTAGVVDGGMGDEKANQQKDENETETSVGEKCEPKTCESNGEGRCVRHWSMMRMIMVTSKRWLERGKGRGFGWKQTKSRKMICLDRNLPPVNNKMILDKPDNERPTSQIRESQGFQRTHTEGVSDVIEILDAGSD